MDNDDTPVGRLLSRRDMLALLGISGAALATGASFARAATRGSPALPACVVRPEQTEGPYFVDERLNRSDIRTDPATGAISTGTPLALSFLISRVSGAACEPLAGAEVHAWHCDGNGVYSDVKDPGFDTTGQRFLRGYQITDRAGRVAFKTIYPGWYPQRAVHIHFKIRAKNARGAATEFTSQLYFDDALTDRVHQAMPYSAKGTGRRRNAADEIFQEHGDQLILAPRLAGSGYEGEFPVGLLLA